MASPLHLAHFGLRTRDLPAAISWYGKVFNAQVRFQDNLTAFMSFDDEHHRFVLWDDGDTGEKPENARGVDHVGFGCGSPSALADHYERLKGLSYSEQLLHTYATKLKNISQGTNKVLRLLRGTVSSRVAALRRHTCCD